MKKFTYYFLVLFLIAINWQATAQLEASVEGVDAYARGRIVEIGINDLGVFGAHAAEPAGYHDNRMDAFNGFGFIANPLDDGWVDYDGDFFTPGSPEEGFGIDINGAVYNNNNSGSLNEIPGVITGVEVVEGECTPSYAQISWSGAVGGLSIDKTFRITENHLFVQMNATITNTTDTAIPNVFWMHNIDPDNNQTIGGSYTTDQEIVAQASSVSDNVSTVTATQAPWGAPTDVDGSSVSYYCDDYRARVSFGGFSNRIPRDVWYGLGGLTTTEGATNTADEAISIAFKLGTIEPGESKEMEYYYFTVDLDDVGVIGIGAGVAGVNPTACDINDGTITISGLNPGIIHNVTFDIDGVPASIPPAGDFMSNAEGEVIITGLPVGFYDNFILEYLDCVINLEEGSDTVLLENPGVLSAGGDGETALCEGDATVQDLFGLLGGLPAAGGVWTDDDASGIDITMPTNVDFSSLGSGEYNFTYTQTSGTCTAEATITVTIYEVPFVTAINDLDECATGSSMFFELDSNTASIIGTQTNVSVTYHFSLADAETGDAPLTSPYENITNPQTIYVRIVNTDHPDCYATDSFVISSALLPVGVNTTEFQCNNSMLSHDLTSDTTLIGNTYTWVATDNPDVTGVSFTGDATLITDTLVNNSTSDQEVVYTVTPTSVGGCLGTDFTVTVTVYADPGVNVIADLPTCDLGENLGLFDLTGILSDIAVDSEDIVSFYLSMEDAEAEVDPLSGLTDYNSQDAVIYVRLEDFNTDCVVYSNFNILVENCEPVIPNAFTPNGDGKNETFEIHKLKGVYEDYRLTIYNRWGNIVYEGGNDDDFWDGKVDGFLSEDPNGATYFYVLELNDDEHEPKKGWVYVKP